MIYWMVIDLGMQLVMLFAFVSQVEFKRRSADKSLIH